MAYESSWTRDSIWAASYATAAAAVAKLDTFNLLCQARDWTHGSAVTRATAVGFLTHSTTGETPQ